MDERTRIETATGSAPKPATLSEETTLPVEIAALYLGILPSELADAGKAKHKDGRVGKGAKTQNAPSSYTVGALRELSKTLASARGIDAAAKGGILGWITAKLPFFAELEPRVKRGRRVLIGNAWDTTHPEREARFAALVDGRIRFAWLTSAEAAASLWGNAADHRAFAGRGLALLAGEVHAIETSIDQTVLLAGVAP